MVRKTTLVSVGGALSDAPKEFRRNYSNYLCAYHVCRVHPFSLFLQDKLRLPEQYRSPPLDQC